MDLKDYYIVSSVLILKYHMVTVKYSDPLTSPDFIVSAMDRESDDHDPVTMGSSWEPPWMIPLEVASKSHSRAKLQSREHEKESSF